MGQESAFLQRHGRRIFAVLVLLVAVVVLWIFFAPIASWIRSAQSFDVVTFLGKHLLVVAIVGGCLLVLVLIWLPKWQAACPKLKPKERFEVENDARKTLAEIVGGAALLMGLYFTWSSLEVNREGQVTERFTKAIDQLGAVNDKGEKQLEIRLGGIYALERIARDSQKDHWPVMEVLTAYVRENAPWPSTPPKDTPPPQDDPTPKGNPAAAPGQLPKLATDIQTVLTVLGRRARTHETAEQRLDLNGTALHNANLRGAQLQGASLEGAQLQGADLTDAQLEGAKNITVTQLSTVKTLYQAQLDPSLLEQIRQLYPQLLEKPQK
jgi:Pentapeptide repeats (8 copies)